MMHGYNHNTDDKAQLINDNLDIVKKIAFFYVGRVGKVVEVDDLLQLGMVGLIEAAHNYTPQDDVSFVNYARLRVKGAIVDYLRKSSNLCRGTIRRKQDYERAKRKLEKELFRQPETHEIAKELKVEVSDFDFQLFCNLMRFRLPKKFFFQLSLSSLIILLASDSPTTKV